MSKKDSVAVRNANIITMDPDRPRAEALAVRHGRIAAIGSWKDVAPCVDGLPVLDLAGKTVLPGFIDTHAHFLWTALSLAALCKRSPRPLCNAGPRPPGCRRHSAR